MTHTITNRGDTTEILIYDVIGESMFGGISANELVSDLNDVQSPTINLRINCPGGSVFEGFALFEALKRHPARVEVNIDSLAASFGSLLAMVGDVIRVAEYSDWMMHEAWGVMAGDAAEHRRYADLLQAKSDHSAEIYARRSGKPLEEIKEMLAAETWLHGQDIVDAGFADEVVAADAIAAAWFDPSMFRNTPADLAAEMNQREPAGTPETWKRSAAERKLRLTKAGR